MHQGGFEVTGLGAEDLKQLEKDVDQYPQLLKVSVAVADTNDVPPMLGNYKIGDGVLRFEPEFPLQPGLSYVAKFSPGKLPAWPKSNKPISARFSIPKPARKPTAVVTQIYPSSNLIAENNLRFYVHFSGPMSRGNVYRHVHLVDEKGKEIELPFLELDEEFWDAKQQRFTLFIDPGRIKQGVKPRVDLGPALEAGKRYTLIIDRDWQDAHGTPMREEFRKQFKVGPPDLVQPKLETWKVSAPGAATRDALSITFPAPLDEALLQRLVQVHDDDGQEIPGKIAISRAETCWQFTPAKPWQAGDYQLVVDTRLEDPSGNSIERPFEVDVFRPIQKQVKTKLVRLPFQVVIMR